jgi:hypothetical protein
VPSEPQRPHRPPRKRSPRPSRSGIKKPGMAEAQRRLWQDPEHRAKMIAARRRTAEARRKNPHKYSRIGVPDGMRKAEATEAWARARGDADRYMRTLETKGIVASTPVPYGGAIPDKAKLCLHELCAIALGPCSLRTRQRALRILLAYTKAPPAVRREIGITADGLLAMVQALGDHEDGGTAATTSISRSDWTNGAREQ